ncbi:hypothetical protein ABW20_dc0110435 [Dactylellina cionopaga]|nr:hypothetical protein ABW20_dc0110435 [Dactylellina cionopaga]
MESERSYPLPSRLFAIPEILSLILANLPVIELITTSRAVCKFWRSTVESSPVLRWQAWNRDALQVPSSLRSHHLKSDCENDTGLTAFEVNPFALHLVEKVWGRYMRQQHAGQHELNQYLKDLISPIEYRLLALRNSDKKYVRTNKHGSGTSTSSVPNPTEDYFGPPMSLLRPTNLAQNIWIHAGWDNSGMGTDARTYRYNASQADGDSVTIDALAKTMVEGLKMRGKNDCDFSSTEVRYYSIVVHAFKRRVHPVPQDAVNDTQITVFLQTVEPYGVAKVETSDEIVDLKYRIPSRRRNSTSVDSWNEVGNAMANLWGAIKAAS